jgi:hypothetical protein
MERKETTLNVVISTTNQSVISRVKDAINDALIGLELNGDWFFWDIQEAEK